MMEFTFRNIVESVSRGQTDRFATNTNVAAKPGDLLMLVSGRPSGFHDFVEQRPDENPIRAAVEISKVEDGPAPFKHFVRWSRLVFGETTPTYQSEVAFDRNGNPRYSRLVAISKRLDETARSVLVVDLEDGEIMTTDLDRLTRADKPEGGSATANDV